MCAECRQFPCAKQCPNYEPKNFYICAECGEKIGDGDTYYEIGSLKYCAECIENAENTAYFDEEEEI